MGNFKRIIIFLLFVIIISCSVYAAGYEDYVGEFNNSGESCIIVDKFVYQIPNPKIFNSDNYDDTVPVFYYCQSENNSVIIVFDIKNKKFYSEPYIGEIVDIGYIRYNIDIQQISNRYFIKDGISFCNDFFGKEEIRQETVNLVAKTAESSNTLLDVKTAKNINTIIKIGKSVGAIGEFNPAVLFTGVACNFNNKDLKDASESLATCNGYLYNIQKGVTRQNYVYELDYCTSNAKTLLKKYIDSPVSQVKNLVDSAYSLVKGLIIKPVVDAIQSKTPTIEIEETEMSVVRSIYNDLSDDITYFHHPEKNKILTEQNKRILEKQYTYENKYVIVNKNLNNLNNIFPSRIKIFFTNVFMVPDYDLSSDLINLRHSKKLIQNSTELFKENKFNSAINNLEYANSLLNNSTIHVSNENKIVRKYDRYAIILTIIIAILIFYLIKRYILTRS